MPDTVAEKVPEMVMERHERGLRVGGVELLLRTNRLDVLEALL